MTSQSTPEHDPISPIEDDVVEQSHCPFSYTRSPSPSVSPPSQQPPQQQANPISATVSISPSEPTPPREEPLQQKPTLSVSISITNIPEATSNANSTSDLIPPHQIIKTNQETTTTGGKETDKIEDYDPSVNAKPYSPFYRHATPSSRLARLTSPSQRKRTLSFGLRSPIDENGVARTPWHRLYDTEKGDKTDVEALAQGRIESKLWAQKKRYCDCLAGLSKGQRMLVKGAIAVVIVGSMVAVALGITAAVGGGVWRGDHQVEVLP
ncbi:hypothetical protein BJY04DRAFT_212878 [Aspergillus karnatakaensis]|uniref:uncharacterized protein n=1 Tax=Aspergillus karnatakaensis TaxID=1810916 RepID=UPI003CCCCF74